MKSRKKPLLLLGAGASVDAGLPSTAAVTDHLESFSAHTSRPSARPTEDLFRRVRAEIASHAGIPASNVDFEAVIGALLEVAEQRNLLTASPLSNLLSIRFGHLNVRRLVQDLVLYVRGLFLPIRSVEYLDVLLRPIWLNEGAIATLNYDICVERRHHELNRRLWTGFGPDGRYKGFATHEAETELLKLHGSVTWLRHALGLEDSFSTLSSLIFFSEPFHTALHRTAAWVAGESRPGVRLLMNIGISKEQLYVTPPFDEIIARFRSKLRDAGILLVAGYSFRDPAINRLLVESLRYNRIPVVIIDPDADRLVTARPVLRAFHDYGVLIAVAKRISEVSGQDVDRSLGVTLGPAPNSIRVPEGAEDSSLSERVHDLAVELSLLEHYLRLTLDQVQQGRLVEHGILHCLVQSTERCWRTHVQGVIAAGISVENHETWHGVYSFEPVDLSASEMELRRSLASLEGVLRQLESEVAPFGLILQENAELHKSRELRLLLETMISALRAAGANVR